MTAAKCWRNSRRTPALFSALALGALYGCADILSIELLPRADHNGADGGQSGDGGAGNSDTYLIGGTVVGLDGGELVLTNSGEEDVWIVQNGDFTFPSRLDKGVMYDVSVRVQPGSPVQSCLVHRGVGVVAESNIDDIRVVCLKKVEPLYPANGRNWNDYVAHDGPTRISASDEPCNPGAASGYGGCMHGGEMRVVEVPGKADCDGLNASDELGAFRWHCDNTGSTVRMVSTGLADKRYLSDLIDFAAPGWRQNRVTIVDAEGVYAESPKAVWWTNTLEIDNNGGTLGVPGTIYLATANPGTPYSIAGDRIGFVVQPGVFLFGSHQWVDVVRYNGTFGWIEGGISAAQDARALVASGRHTVVRGVNIKDALAETNVQLSLDDSLFMDVNVTNGARDGLHYLSGSRTVLFRVQMSNVGWGVLQLGGQNVVMGLVTSIGNVVAGIELRGPSTALLGATTLNSETVGLRLDAPHLAAHAVAALNDADGAMLTENASGASLVNAAIASGGNDLSVASGGNYFGGLLKLRNACVLIGSPQDPGIDADCLSLGPSDHEIHSPIAIPFTLVGKVGDGGPVDTTQDDVNPSDDLTPGTDSTITLVWHGFENAYRAWGRDGGPFPADNQRGRCSTGIDTHCRIWDASLAEGDMGDPDGSGPTLVGPVALGVVPIPTATDLFEHRLTGIAAGQSDCDNLFDGSTFVGPNDCRVSFLRHSYELLGDAFGNENLLCEWGETCVYMPNIGSYQGHGPLIPLTTLIDDMGSSIELLRHQQNGVP